MKTYQETENSYVIGDTSIPKHEGHWLYKEMMKEVAAGEAEINPYTPSGPSFNEINADKLNALRDIDNKSIRALREGDTARIAQYEAEAQAIRDSFIS